MPTVVDYKQTTPDTVTLILEFPQLPDADPTERWAEVTVDLEVLV